MVRTQRSTASPRLAAAQVDTRLVLRSPTVDQVDPAAAAKSITTSPALERVRRDKEIMADRSAPPLVARPAAAARVVSEVLP
jgi:hypothetical protein